MGLFDAIDISGSALSAERLRMDVTAENLANANTTRGANGAAYRRKVVVLEQQAGGGQGSFGNQLASAMNRGSAAKPAGGQGAGPPAAGWWCWSSGRGAARAGWETSFPRP